MLDLIVLTGNEVNLSVITVSAKVTGTVNKLRISFVQRILTEGFSLRSFSRL
jgi:hypothetical protein